jgi:hypothetical protein
MGNVIRLRPTRDRSWVVRDGCGRVYEAWYRGMHVGLIRRVRRKSALWRVWQDNHGHAAKGVYRSRGAARRGLLRAVVEFRHMYPMAYGVP